MTTVSTNAELMAALSTAVGGETIALVAGDYEKLNIWGFMFPSDVTIISADPANPAVVRGVYLRDSSHLVFDGILFDVEYDPANPTALVEIFRSSFTTIRNSVFDGPVVPDANGVGEYGYGYGLYLYLADNITVENNEFFDFGKAIVALLSPNVTVIANNVHTISGDIFNFISPDGLLVEGNWLHDFNIDPTSGNHPDMIQLWTSLPEPSVRNVVIRGNFIDAGLGNWTQSIYMANPVTLEPFLNILIEDNVVYNDHAHGITVGFTDGLVIRNNTLLQDPHTINAFSPPRIILTEGSLNLTVENNITGDVWDWDTMTSDPGWTVSNNLLLEYDSASPDYYVPLFVNPLAINATLADLRAVAGGLIEQTVVGAAMTRADILLLTGPYATAPDPVPEPSVCEALLDDAMLVLENLETQLTASQASLASVTGLMDVALAERDTAEAALVDADAALVSMTAERDTALAERDAALTAQTDAEDQLAAALVKLDAIRVILEAP